MENKPLGLFSDILIEKYDIPIGFEGLQLDKDHNDYNFEINAPFKPIRIAERRYYGNQVTAVVLRQIKEDIFYYG